MLTIDKNSSLWQYLSEPLKGLIEEGIYLYKSAKAHPDIKIADYSYLVFPFAKAYEGFLKKLFLDLSFISQKEYESDRFRIGRSLNPHLEKKLRHLSVYDKIVLYHGDKSLADEIWSIWKRGRNLVFHYFPGNFRALTLSEAEKIIEEMLVVMEKSVKLLQK